MTNNFFFAYFKFLTYSSSPKNRMGHQEWDPTIPLEVTWIWEESYLCFWLSGQQHATNNIQIPFPETYWIFEEWRYHPNQSWQRRKMDSAAFLISTPEKANLSRTKRPSCLRIKISLILLRTYTLFFCIYSIIIQHESTPSQK